MLRYLKLPDLITILNALLGLIAILNLINGGNVTDSMMLILISAMVDGCDGIIARRIEHGIFGKDLDSLADLVSFGIAPTCILYFIFNAHTYVVCALCGAYLVCGILRLARFNVRGAGEYFEGIPITISAASLCVFLTFIRDPIPVFFLVGILCLLMVSEIRYPNIRDKRAMVPLGLLFLTILILYHLSFPYVYPAMILFSLFVLYFFSPIISENIS
ncbi:MAG: CDP-diacylglycerol--serine O-phosphatidyltransferase [Candidatus Syntropharchaeia archaeon]